MIPGFPMGLSKSRARPIIQGQDTLVLSTSGNRTESWVVPTDVTSISILSVGIGGTGQGPSSTQGGGAALAYANGVTVTPGETLTAEKVEGDGGFFGLRRGATWLCKAENGDFGSSGGTGGRTANSVGDVTNSGGNGGFGGGGAAGYSGNGGNGSPSLEADGTSGAGGGGGGGAHSAGGECYLGGGVGLTGEGVSGAGGTYNGTSQAMRGKAGSGGINNSLGGGGGTDLDTFGGESGGPGAVRIIWGPDRSYPNNAEDV